jgi:uncharacterized protein YndB with AHSA1/START domain
MTRKQPNSWRSLNRRLNAMTEDEVKAALVAEIDGERRVTVVERLHHRFSALRATRERLELMTEIQRETAQPVPNP